MSLIFYVDSKRFLKEYYKRVDKKIDNMEWYVDETLFHGYIVTDNVIYCFETQPDAIPEPIKMLISEDGMVLGIKLEQVDVKIEQQPKPIWVTEDGRML
jgi:hypothetical protein